VGFSVKDTLSALANRKADAASSDMVWGAYPYHKRNKEDKVGTVDMGVLKEEDEVGCRHSE
jgi:hypothetical protein